MDGFQYHFVAGGGQGCQRHGFLDAENARLGRAIGAAGIDESFGFGNGHIGSAAIVAHHFGKFQRAAGCGRDAG